ncbi:MAG: hypothetical protein P0Y52_06620 [Candidatus Brevundimonas phytovorans]|nr:hypothetical protein [Brevundimonas sp.]WEK59210.1 MAG: hypothetical protein P0Y52_06620 [Brevundimonas sp.]
MKLIVAPLREVGGLLARYQPSHLVSLASPGHVDDPLADPLVHRLDLRFNDIAEVRPGLTPPSPADINALLVFAESWNGVRPLLIHCWAGISRSTAAAYAVACAKSAPGGEADWAERLRAAAPTATPNPLIVALADRHLNRNGAMTRAIAAMGRGAEAAWGEPFELDLSSRP